MQIFDVFTILLIFAAVFSYLNARFKALPPTVGFMVGSLIISLVLICLQYFGLGFAQDAIDIVSGVDFEQTVLYGILSFLLFAGSLQLEIRDLAQEKWVILTLATLGVIISTFIVGGVVYIVFPLFGINISFLYALIFGALISPTDPVVVIGTLKGIKTPKSLKMQLIGEALFNDGIAIILFVILVALSRYELSLEASSIAAIICMQVFGSLGLGLLLGLLMHKLVGDVDNANTRVLITLGCVAGGYDLAMYFGISAPITIVIAGLFFRNYKAYTHHESFKPLYEFWTLLDEFLNAMLFILVGLEILSLSFTLNQVLAGFFSILIVLFGRYISVWLPINTLSFFQRFSKNAVKFLTWAGLRGGISLAMALSLPEGYISNAIRCCTYIVVLFSTLAQGLTLKRFFHR